jgi:hypothetical protein
MTDFEVRRWLRVHEQRMAACRPGGAIHKWYLAILDGCGVVATCERLDISRQTSVNWRNHGIPVEQVQRLAEIRKAVRK